MDVDPEIEEWIRKYVNFLDDNEIQCQQIVVGDLVKVDRDHDVPCDLILLYTSEHDNFCCYATTSNLDGETNYKTLYVPKVASTMTMDEIVSLDAVLTYQHPFADLYAFHGKIEIKKDDETNSGHLAIENLLLRGAQLKDTDFIIGCAVYTGQDTKLSLNSKVANTKFSTAERSINLYLTIFIFIMLCSVTISTVIKKLFEAQNHWDIYLGEDKKNNNNGLFAILNDCLNFMVLYSYLIPISLYITVEMQKFLSSLFFDWDIELYDKESDQPAIANTSDLNEELGQVEYLLSDKTGTLTENLMIFRRCYINGKAYIENDCDGRLHLLPPDGNQQNATELSNLEPEVRHFLLSISLCHVVNIAPPSVRASACVRRSIYRESFKRKIVTRVYSSLLMDPGLPEYEAASADEKALVEASARCGVIFESVVNDTIQIRIKDKMLTFKRLEVLEFSSTRKRMSVIVQDPMDDLWLYCKGADSAMLPLIKEGNVEEAITHVSDFSKEGLRTLVIGYKQLTKTDYENFMLDIRNAREIIGEERTASIQEAYEHTESGLTLLGVTAIEDHLQDGVSETIENLRSAGIKVWILTGDKAETAENIALSCGHFKQETQVLKLMNQESIEDCYTTLTSFDRRIKLNPLEHYGFLMDGCSMNLAYKNFPELLRPVTTSCEAVLCSRLSPLQKSEIVQLIKMGENEPVTAVIGDGGNDVSMIKEARVGIGIIGKEGRQAAMSADFAVTKFMHLKKVLLVHGHWYYERISTLILYFFYKNVVFITPQMLYSIYNGFSTQALYDSIFMMSFNVFFTSMPILVYGLLEQKYSSEKLLQFPELYQLNKWNNLLSLHQFIAWIGLGVWHACVIFFMSYKIWSVNPVILHDGTPADQWCFSIFVFHMVIKVTNLQIFMYSSFRTLAIVLSCIFSEVLFLLMAVCYTVIYIRFDGDIYWVYIKILMSPTSWLLSIVILVIAFVPVEFFNYYNANRTVHNESRSVAKKAGETDKPFELSSRL